MPPYLAGVMELAYAVRLRGIEVTILTDAHALPEGIRSNRRNGRLDNITHWTPRLLDLLRRGIHRITETDILLHGTARRTDECFQARTRSVVAGLLAYRRNHETVDVVAHAIIEMYRAKIADDHMLRYTRRSFAWAIRRGHCQTNPAKGVRQAKERGAYKMPNHPVFDAILAFARARGVLKAHTDGSLSPYLAPAMELAYGCRLRGIEVNTLTDAQALPEGILSNRRKGSLDNVTRWNPRPLAAWDDLVALRREAYERTARPVPLHPSQRFLIVSHSGEPLRKSSLDSAWQRLMDAAVEAGVISEQERFTLHGLKHRGITDSEDKASGGHKSESMRQRYDHEVPLVEPPKVPEFSRQFSRSKEKGT